MTNLCPYCKGYDFYLGDFVNIHSHLIDCSKTYVSRMLGMTLKQFEHDAAKVLDRRSNDSTRRARIGDRRIKNQTLYFYTNVPTGKFLDKDGFMLPDRRNHRSRRFPGERRKS